MRMDSLRLSLRTGNILYHTPCVYLIYFGIPSNIVHKFRLEGLAAFDKDSVEFCARKVAAVSGDVRRALSICRRATELCQIEKESHEHQEGEEDEIMLSQKNLVEKSGIRVKIEHIERATQDLFSSNYSDYIQKAGIYEK